MKYELTFMLGHLLLHRCCCCFTQLMRFVQTNMDNGILLIHLTSDYSNNNDRSFENGVRKRQTIVINAIRIKLKQIQQQTLHKNA